MTMVHELKCWPQFFQAIVDGRKNFECRYDDRGYQAGDKVLLREWQHETVWRFTGRAITATIGYVLSNPVGRRGETFNGYVVFSLLDIEVVQLGYDGPIPAPVPAEPAPGGEG